MNVDGASELAAAASVIAACSSSDIRTGTILVRRRVSEPTAQRVPADVRRCRMGTSLAWNAAAAASPVGDQGSRVEHPEGCE